MTCTYIHDGRTVDENALILKAYEIGKANGAMGKDQNQIEDYRENMYETLGKVSVVEIYAAEEGFEQEIKKV